MIAGAAAAVGAPSSPRRRPVPRPHAPRGVPPRRRSTASSAVERDPTRRPEVALTSKRLGEFEADRETAGPAHRRPPPRPAPGRAARARGRLAAPRLLDLGAAHQPRRQQARARPQGARPPHRRRRSTAARGSCPCSRARAASARPPSRRCSAWHSPTPATTASSPSTRTPTAARWPSASPAPSGKTVRDLVRARGEVVGYNDLSSDRRPRRDPARRARVGLRPARVRGLQRRRLPRRRVARRALLLDRADRHRHRHRALGHGRDARPRRPARGRRRASASTRRGSRPRPSPGSRPTATREQVRNAVVVLNTARPGTPARAARRARDALPQPRARCRPHAVRPASSPPAAPSPSATCSPRRASPRASSPPRSSRGCARSPAAAWRVDGRPSHPGLRRPRPQSV